MKNGNHFGAAAIITLVALTAPAEAGRKCYDDHGNRHSCNIIFDNYVGGYDGQPFVSHHPKKNRPWRKRYPTHQGYILHDHDNNLGGNFIDGLGYGMGKELGGEFAKIFKGGKRKPRYYEEDYEDDDFDDEEVIMKPPKRNKVYGPFDGVTAIAPKKGEDGKTAHWFAIVDGERIYFESCYQHGDNIEEANCEEVVSFTR